MTKFSLNGRGEFTTAADAGWSRYERFVWWRVVGNIHRDAGRVLSVNRCSRKREFIYTTERDPTGRPGPCVWCATDPEGSLDAFLDFEADREEELAS